MFYVLLWFFNTIIKFDPFFGVRDWKNYWQMGLSPRFEDSHLFLMSQLPRKGKVISFYLPAKEKIVHNSVKPLLEQTCTILSALYAEGTPAWAVAVCLVVAKAQRWPEATQGSSVLFSGKDPVLWGEDTQLLFRFPALLSQVGIRAQWGFPRSS